MPLTDAERAFLDLLADEYQHRSVAPMWCNRQLRGRSIDPDEALPLLVLRREEWWVVGPDYFDAKSKSPGWAFPPDPPPCPWPDAAGFRRRLGRLRRRRPRPHPPRQPQAPPAVRATGVGRAKLHDRRSMSLHRPIDLLPSGERNSPDQVFLDAF